MTIFRRDSYSLLVRSNLSTPSLFECGSISRRNPSPFLPPLVPELQFGLRATLLPFAGYPPGHTLLKPGLRAPKRSFKKPFSTALFVPPSYSFNTEARDEYDDALDCGGENLATDGGAHARSH